MRIKAFACFVDAVLCFVMTVLLRTVCAPCENGMKCVAETNICYYILLITGIIFAVFMLLGIASYRPSLRRKIRIPNWVPLGLGVLVGITLFMFSILSGCTVETMPCRTRTFPTIGVFSVLWLILHTSMFVRKKVPDAYIRQR